MSVVAEQLVDVGGVGGGGFRSGSHIHTPTFRLVKINVRVFGLFIQGFISEYSRVDQKLSGGTNHPKNTASKVGVKRRRLLQWWSARNSSVQSAMVRHKLVHSVW